MAGEGQLSRQGERLPSLFREPALSEAFARRDVSGLGRGARSRAQRHGRCDAARGQVESNPVVEMPARSRMAGARVCSHGRNRVSSLCAHPRADHTVPRRRFPALAEELHPDRNVGIEPSELAGRSNRLVWWRCSRGHEWEARVSDRAAGNGCPHCYRERRSAAAVGEGSPRGTFLGRISYEAAGSSTSQVSLRRQSRVSR